MIFQPRVGFIALPDDRRTCASIISTLTVLPLSRLPCTLLMEEPLWLVGHAAAEMSMRVRVVYDEIAAIIAANADLLTGRRGTREQLGVEGSL